MIRMIKGLLSDTGQSICLPGNSDFNRQTLFVYSLNNILQRFDVSH